MKEFNSNIFVSRLKTLLNNDSRPKGEFYKTVAASGIVFNWNKRGSAPQADKLLAIAQYFNVTVDYLVGLSDDPGPHKPKVTYPIPQRNDELRFESPPDKQYGISNPEVSEAICQVKRIFNRRGSRDIDKLKLFLSALDPGDDVNE
jgi:transcriptional regulator with XRE-family HTH domain